MAAISAPIVFTRSAAVSDLISKLYKERIRRALLPYTEPMAKLFVIPANASKEVPFEGTAETTESGVIVKNAQGVVIGSFGPRAQWWIEEPPFTSEKLSKMSDEGLKRMSAILEAMPDELTDRQAVAILKILKEDNENE